MTTVSKANCSWRQLRDPILCIWCSSSALPSTVIDSNTDIHVMEASRTAIAAPKYGPSPLCPGKDWKLLSLRAPTGGNVKHLLANAPTQPALQAAEAPNYQNPPLAQARKILSWCCSFLRLGRNKARVYVTPDCNAASGAAEAAAQPHEMASKGTRGSGSITRGASCEKKKMTVKQQCKHARAGASRSAAPLVVRLHGSVGTVRHCGRH